MTVTPVNDAPVAVANVYAVNKQMFTVPAFGVVERQRVDGHRSRAVNGQIRQAR